MKFQRAAYVSSKIEGLLSRVVALENQFDSLPRDAAELRRRDELRRYVATFSPGRVLSAFQ